MRVAEAHSPVTWGWRVRASACLLLIKCMLVAGMDTGDTAVNRTYFSVLLRSSQPSEGVRYCIEMAAVLVANSCVQMFIAALFVIVKKCTKG